LEENGMVQEAITEYKRNLFFNEINDEEKGIIWLKLAACYRKINDEAEMMKSFNQSFSLLKGSPFLLDLYEELCIFYLSRGKSEWARMFLNKINTIKPDGKHQQYLILSYLMDEDWPTFYSLLKRAGYAEPVFSEIQNLVDTIKKNNRKLKILRAIDIFFPGIIYCFYNDYLSSGESFLFHFFFIEQIWIESSLLGKLIYGFGLSRLYLKSRVNNKNFLQKKIDEKKMVLEEKIFDKLFDLSEN
jgi:tetratricopeptide (TPR) repeat protein